jgi:hypothetical protein
MAEDSLPVESVDLSGIRLYKPGVLAAYFVLGNLPIGMALYALNVARRGDRILGYFLFGASALALVLLIVVALAGRNLRGWTLLALVIGLAVFRIELRPYRVAVKRGAMPARWWPPLLAVVALMLVLAALLPGS